MKGRTNDGFEFKKKILILLLLIIGLIIIGVIFMQKFQIYRSNNIFAQEVEQMQDELNNPIFKLEKVLVYSDANVEDLSENGDLSNINVSQFTDFAIYINNTVTIEELTEENTVNNIYIDNINVTSISLGDQKVNYKDINNLCIYEEILEGTNKIEFNVLHSNSEKEENTISNIFYTDCSEPLILTYINENIVKKEDLSESNSVISLDGSVLNYLGVDADDLNYKISFTINIENNLGELFKCNYALNVDLSNDEGGICTGYIMQIYDLSESNYKFKKCS